MVMAVVCGLILKREGTGRVLLLLGDDKLTRSFAASSFYQLVYVSLLSEWLEDSD